MIILALVVSYITTLVTLGIGIYIGMYLKEPEKFRRMMKIPEKKTVNIGPVNRPTAEEVSKRGTLREETEKEMSRQLRELGLKPNND